MEKTPPSEDGEALLKTDHQKVIEPQWFALYTQPRHEKSLARYMDMRQIEHYLPLYRSRRRWKDGSRMTVDLPLFPSYIFVRIQKNEKVRVLELPGAVYMITGTGGDPHPMPDAVISTLRSGLSEKEVQPHPLLMVGERVRIRNGAFSGMEGVINRHKGDMRVVITLELIMRSISVEVNGEDLEVLSHTVQSQLRVSA